MRSLPFGKIDRQEKQLLLLPAPVRIPSRHAVRQGGNLTARELGSRFLARRRRLVRTATRFSASKFAGP